MSENWKQWKGQTVGNDFRLMEYLGGSATSAVYLAVATDDAKAAIKLVADDPATAEVHLAQWRVAESLSHPHLLRVRRSGRCEIQGISLLYVVMEYAEENLAEILPLRSLTVEEVRQMLPPVLDVLDYLHSNELMHGNLKPGNIMAAGEQLKLSGDALQKFGEFGKQAGAYCAPEAARGLSAASDVWSLGVTLVEVLTQHLPVWDPGAALPQLPDNLPEQFRVIVQHCLLQDPNLRAKTADIRERLKPVATQAKPTPVAAPKQPARAPALAQRSSKRFIIPVAIAAVIIGVVIAVPHKSQRTPEAEKPVAAMPTPEPQAPTPAPTSTPTVMSEATEPVPAVQNPEPQKNEPMQVIVPEKVSVAEPKPVVAAPVRVQAPAAVAAEKQDGIVTQVLPDVPRKAMRTISGKFRVRVKVQVDRQGNVVDSEFASAGPSKYFANLAMQAARQWKFTPSESANRAWDLQFEFRRSGTTSFPTQLDR